MRLQSAVVRTANTVLTLDVAARVAVVQIEGVPFLAVGEAATVQQDSPTRR